jgi:type II secretory pathway component GspD/PulD (secretin)
MGGTGRQAEKAKTKTSTAGNDLTPEGDDTLTRIIALAYLVIFLIALPAFARPASAAGLESAQRQTDPKAPDHTEETRASARQQRTGPPQKAGGSAGGLATRNVSFNFDDADVYSVAQTVFGDLLRVNYIIDSRVKGRVTFRSVAPVPTDAVVPLMEVILRLNGIGIVEEEGLYRLLPISELSRETGNIGYGREADKVSSRGKALLQVIPIRHVASSDMAKIITPFLSQNAVLIDVPKGNQIIVVDTDANIKRVLRLVDIFDNESLRKRKPSVFVYTVQNGKAKDVAALLQQIFMGRAAERTTAPPAAKTPAQSVPPSAPGASPPPGPPPFVSIPGAAGSGAEGLVSDTTRIFPDEVTNSIIVMATPEDYEIIQETIKKIDVVPRQVVLEGIVAQINLQDNLSLGVAWSVKARLNFRVKPFDRTTLDGIIGQNPSALQVDPVNPTNSGFTFVGTDDEGVVRALVNALSSDSRGKLLAAPHILVSDNREARIQVGQQVPLVTSETFGSTTVAPQRTIQYRDIGIILKVRPQVNESGLVSLDLNQEISTFSLLPLSGTQRDIILNKTEATTNLVVQDGQTIVIGGLIREDTSKSRVGIPFINKIPLIGRLFGSTDDEVKRNEIIILLTPHVIKNQQEARQFTSDYIDSFTKTSKGMKKEELLNEKGRVSVPAPSPGTPHGLEDRRE